MQTDTEEHQEHPQTRGTSWPILTALHNEPPCKLTTFPPAGWWCLPQIKILKGLARLQLYTFSFQLPLMRAHFQQPFEYISNLIMRLGCHFISQFLFWFIICDFCFWLKSCCFFSLGWLRKTIQHTQQRNVHTYSQPFFWCYFFVSVIERQLPQFLIILTHSDWLLSTTRKKFAQHQNCRYFNSYKGEGHEKEQQSQGRVVLFLFGACSSFFTIIFKGALCKNLPPWIQTTNKLQPHINRITANCC